MSDFREDDARLGAMHGYRGPGHIVAIAETLERIEAKLDALVKAQGDTVLTLDGRIPVSDAQRNADTNAYHARMEAKLDALSTALLEMAKAMIARGSL